MAISRFFSANLVSEEDGDLITQFRTACGDANAILRGLTLISDAETKVSINGGAAADLYLDVDTKYKLSLPPDTILISSLITDTAGANIWLAGAY